MKRFLLVFTALTLFSCSFDNKTGIWKDASIILDDNQGLESISDNPSATRYEDIFLKNQSFNEEKKADSLSKVEIDNPVRVANWFEQYAIPTNNISNFSYNDNKILLSKSSKLSRMSSKKNNAEGKIIFYKNDLISYDQKGTIFIYSLSLNKKIFEFNFYNKKFKKFNKKINFLINENILYVSDNLGYLYAINLEDNSILWAKNYGIPFRSNLKFANNQIFMANQDNVIYSIDANTGKKNWQFATSTTFLKSDFMNNFALDLINNNLFFLNTSGELYSINYQKQKINWVLNFKNPSLAGDTDLFLSYPLIIKDNNLIVTTEKAVLNYNTVNSTRNWSFSAEPVFKPIITLNNTYVVLNNDLLVCLDNINGKIVWSKNIFNSIKKKKIIEKFGPIADFKIVNSKINIYSKNGYLLSFDPNNGNLNSLSRVHKNGINSKIVFLNDNMLFIDAKNKLLKFN